MEKENKPKENVDSAPDKNSVDAFTTLVSKAVPTGSDRRAFMMRSALVGVIAAATGCSAPSSTSNEGAPPAVDPAASTPPLSPDLDVVKKTKGPVMTTIDEFYKVGPGPSSSHT